MKLWIDDERPAPEGWTQARTLIEAIYYMYTMGDCIEEIALDHDLGHPSYRDADLIANLIESLAAQNHIRRIPWQILTDNPAGTKKIRAALVRADEHWDLWEELTGKAPLTNEHVRYEWQMLEACYYTLKKLRGGMAIPAMIPGGEGPNGTFFFNMLHEDFCVHARNLLQWYYAGGLVMPQEIAFIKQKINDQVVTLIPDFRTSKAEEKIGDEDRRILYEHIQAFMKDEAQRNSQTDQI